MNREVSRSAQSTVGIFAVLSLLSATVVGASFWRDQVFDPSQVESPLLLAAVVYIFSHVFRVVRLVALSIDDPKGAYLVAPAHLITAPLGFFIPFKLGELFRLLAITASFDRIKKGLLIWLLERIGDVLVLMVAGTLLLLFGRSVILNSGAIVLAITLGSMLVLLSFWAVFDLSSFLIEVLVLRSKSKAGFFLLKQFSELRQLATNFARSLNGRLLTLFVTSIFIWGSELGALLIIQKDQPGSSGSDVSTMLTNLLNPSVSDLAIYGAVGGRSQAVLLLGGLACAVFFRRKFKSSSELEA